MLEIPTLTTSSLPGSDVTGEVGVERDDEQQEDRVLPVEQHDDRQRGRPDNSSGEVNPLQLVGLAAHRSHPLRCECCLGVARAPEIPLEPVEPAHASREERVLAELALFSFSPAWISYMVNGFVEVGVEGLDLLGAGIQRVLALEVAPVGEDRPDLSPSLVFQILDDRPTDVGLVEELETRVGPVEDFF